MSRLLAYFLAGLLLFQTFGRELLVLNFAVNRAAITAKYCVNKARPRLHCDGRCYLTRQLRRAENGHPKVPTNALAKVKFDVMAPSRVRLAPPSWAGPAAARRYKLLVARARVTVPTPAIFHPPVLLG